MGTRNITMVISNGETRVAQYGQWDGYPEGQGATALRIMTDIVNKGELAKFKERVDKLMWLTKDQEEKLEKLGDDWESAHPYLSRDWGAQILEAVMYGKLHKEKGYVSAACTYEFDILGLVDSTSFAGDSLFCEWGYVIDLDKNTFEVYKGFNDDSRLTEEDRFFSLQETKEATAIANQREYKYFPIKLAATFNLTALPTPAEFLATFQTEEDEEEEVETSNE